MFVRVQIHILSVTPPVSRHLLRDPLIADQALSAQDALQLHRRALAWYGRDVQDGETSHEKLSSLLGVSAE